MNEAVLAFNYRSDGVESALLNVFIVVSVIHFFSYELKRHYQDILLLLYSDSQHLLPASLPTWLRFWGACITVQLLPLFHLVLLHH